MFGVRGGVGGHCHHYWGWWWALMTWQQCHVIIVIGLAWQQQVLMMWQCHCCCWVGMAAVGIGDVAAVPRHHCQVGVAACHTPVVVPLSQHPHLPL